MKKDISNTVDIKKLVDRFYEKVRQHKELGNIFGEIMHVDWNIHLPKMYRFWENIAFHNGAYKGFPFAAHMPVNEKVPLTPELFNEWLELFHSTIDELFEGPEAYNLKFRSKNIKEVWSAKIEFINTHHVN